MKKQTLTENIEQMKKDFGFGFDKPQDHEENSEQKAIKIKTKDLRYNDTNDYFCGCTIF